MNRQTNKQILRPIRRWKERTQERTVIKVIEDTELARGVKSAIRTRKALDTVHGEQKQGNKEISNHRQVKAQNFDIFSSREIER